MGERSWQQCFGNVLTRRIAQTQRVNKKLDGLLDSKSRLKHDHKLVPERANKKLKKRTQKDSQIGCSQNRSQNSNDSVKKKHREARMSGEIEEGEKPRPQRTKHL